MKPPPPRCAFFFLVLLSCSQATTGTSHEPDAAPATDGPADACDPAANSGPPFTFDRMRDFQFGDLFNLAIGATGPGRVGIVVGTPALQYLDSLDGGASFRPPIAIGAVDRDNLHFAMGQGFASLTYAHLASGAQLFLHRAPLAAGGVTAFSPPVMVSDQDASDGRLVFGPGQRLALNTSNSGAVDGFHVSFSENRGATFGPKIEIDPYALVGPGVFDGAGRLFVFYLHNNSTVNWVIHVRASDAGGTSFGPPVTRQIEGSIDEGKGNFAFATPRGLGFMKVHQIPSTDRAPLVIDHFDPATSTWGQPTTAFAEAKLRCWAAATLDDGRLVLTLHTETTPPQNLLLLSSDGGQSFARQELTLVEPGELCPLLAAAGGAAYLLLPRADRSLLFVRATPPPRCGDR